ATRDAFFIHDLNSQTNVVQAEQRVRAVSSSMPRGSGAQSLGEPAFVARRGPAGKPLLEPLCRSAAHTGPQAGDDVGILEHLALRVAAADARQLGQGSAQMANRHRM